MAKCAICKKEENSLLKVKHKELGMVKLCFECWGIEYGNQNLLPSCGGGCDCCRF
nr:hypothetical protein [Methanosarcina sp. KYL-1]